MASSRPANSARSLNVVQVTSFILAFILVAGVGGVLSAGLFLPVVGAAGALVKSSVKMFDELPDDLNIVPLSEMSEIFWSDGTSMAKIYTEDRIVVPLEKMSPAIREAAVAIEDRRFYEHGGVDPKGMIRAFVSNTTSGKTQGASTLTQQYVKNSLLNIAGGDPEKIEDASGHSIARKLREAKLSVSIEKKMSKDEILTGYLNIAQFGRSVYGVEAAALHYFNVHAADLTMEQAVILAGITQNPAKLDPGIPENIGDDKTPDTSTFRRNQVVNAMVETEKLTQEEADELKAVPVANVLQITDNTNGCVAAGEAAYFCNYVTKVIAKNEVFGKTEKERTDKLYKGGLKIYTTLDKHMQAAAIARVFAAVPADNPALAAHGLVSVVPNTGEIRAMAQDRTYTPAEGTATETNMNYNVDSAYGGGAGIQPGSSFKPFALATALKNGASLNDTVNGGRVSYANKDFRVGGCGAEYAASSSGYDTSRGGKPVRNAESSAAGAISILQATSASVNTAYMDLLSTRMTLCEMRDTAMSMGMHDPRNGPYQFTPASVLGSNEIAPLTIASAYGTFANNGVHCDPIAITKITDPTGKPVKHPPANCKQVISPDVAANVSHALQTALSSGTGRGKALSGRTSAGKTGTTNSNAQAWFVGYTAQLATASWVSTPSKPSTPLVNVNLGSAGFTGRIWGATIPLDSWRAYMNEALAGVPDQPFGIASSTIAPEETTDKISVPDVIGMPWKEGRTVLTEAGLSFDQGASGAVPSSLPKDSIISVNPAVGSEVEPGATVTITVSQGP